MPSGRWALVAALALSTAAAHAEQTVVLTRWHIAADQGSTSLIGEGEVLGGVFGLYCTPTDIGFVAIAPLVKSVAPVAQVTCGSYLRTPFAFTRQENAIVSVAPASGADKYEAARTLTTLLEGETCWVRFPEIAYMIPASVRPSEFKAFRAGCAATNTPQ